LAFIGETIFGSFHAMGEQADTIKKLHQELETSDKDREDLKDNLSKLKKGLSFAEERSEEDKENVSKPQKELSSAELKKELSRANDKVIGAEEQHGTMQRKIEATTKEKADDKNTMGEQEDIIKNLNERLESLTEDYRQRFAELRETFEVREKKRLSEVVELRSTANKDVDRRLKQLIDIEKT
jgi:chromosome segregation ATPase